MAAIQQESVDHFRVRFAELARGLVRGFGRGDRVQVDPFLIARAIAEVMRACTFRGVTGQRLLWNEYRMILARSDFELVRALQAPLERDLAGAMASEKVMRESQLVGDLRITVVPDEGDELSGGDAVVRVGFVPTEQLLGPRAGELTMRFDAVQLTGIMQAVGPTETVIVADTDAGGAPYLVRWPGGEVSLPVGASVVLGRPHDAPPPHFVALTGASARVNKQHLWIAAFAGGVRIGRLAGANPVHVDGSALAAGAEVTATAPAEVSLSRGELVVTIVRR